MTSNNCSRIISPENIEGVSAYEEGKVSANFEGAAKPRQSTNGYFIPLNYEYANGKGYLTVQTALVDSKACGIANCSNMGQSASDDPTDPAINYKVGLVMLSNTEDLDDASQKLSEDEKTNLQVKKQIFEIFEKYSEEVKSSLLSSSKVFLTSSKIRHDDWKAAVNGFSVLNKYQRDDGSINWYLNPKIVKSAVTSSGKTLPYVTSIIYQGKELPITECVQKFSNVKFQCIALITVESVFYQTSSKKLFPQVKLKQLLITQIYQNKQQQIKLPSRVLRLAVKPEEIVHDEQFAAYDDKSESEDEQ